MYLSFSPSLPLSLYFYLILNLRPPKSSGRDEDTQVRGVLSLITFLLALGYLIGPAVIRNTCI